MVDGLGLSLWQGELMDSFVVDGGSIVQGRVSTMGVVPSLDEFEDGDAGLRLRLERDSVEDHRRGSHVMERLLEYFLRRPVVEANTRYRPGPNTVTLYYREQRYQRGQVRRIGNREVLTVRAFLARLACQIPEPGFQP